MSRRQSISAYTPSNTDPEILKRIFVQREKLFKQITERLCRSVTSGDKHHVLLVGPRGSGKTHFVSLVEWELRKRTLLEKQMCICWLGEDDSFTGLIHLAFGIAKQLAKAYPDDFPENFKEAVRGLPRDDAALAVLNSVVEQLGSRTLVLITENLDQTFSGLGDGGRKKWRAFLQETRCIATLATSQQIFDGVSKREEVFFGFFDVQHLKVLSVIDAHELIRRIAVEQKKLELIAYLDSAEGRYRVRALHYLAGGNHRMYVLLAEFLSRESLDSLVKAFEDLAEELTPYFQERMRALPDQQRQLAQCLCDAEGALTVKQISEDTFIEERTSSKQLGNLKKRGYVRSEKRGKESYYDMAEPLMRLCLEVKNQRGEPLRLVARFLRAWFPENRLLSESNSMEAKSRVDDYRVMAMKSSRTFDKAIALSIENEIAANMQAGKYSNVSDLAKELLFADKSAALLTEARLSAIQGDVSRVLENCTGVIESEDVPAEHRAMALYYRGNTHGEQGNVDLQLADYTAVIEMSDAPVVQRAIALYNRGVTHGEQGNIDLQLADYTAVIGMSDAQAEHRVMALINRGFTYGELGNVDLRVANYTAVIEMSDASAEHRATALYNRGVTYGEQGNVDLQLADYTAVIEMSDTPAEQRAMALNNRGFIHGVRGNVDLQLADYTAVIEMSDASADRQVIALRNRGITYGEQGNVALQLADYTAIIEMSDAPVDQRAMALINRGLIHREQDNVDLQLADYTAVIEMSDAPADQHAIALGNRGSAHGKRGNVDLQLADYTAVIEMADAPVEQRANALYNRAVTMWQKQKYERSVEDFRSVLMLDGIGKSTRTDVLFALVGPLVALDSRETVLLALERAFNEGEPDSNHYGGTPHDLLLMVLRQNTTEWPAYCAGIAVLYDQYDVADMLGQGITRSIQFLDEGDYTESQLMAWLAAWHAAGDQYDDLRIPLQCLDSAVAVMISDTPTDVPLLSLPMEIRQLVRPLLNSSLGIVKEEK